MKQRDLVFGVKFLLAFALVALSAQVAVALEIERFGHPVYLLMPVYGVALGVLLVGGLGFVPAVFFGALVPMAIRGGELQFVMSLPLAVTLSAVLGRRVLVWTVSDFGMERLRDTLIVFFGGGIGVTLAGAFVETTLVMSSGTDFRWDHYTSVFLTNWLAAAVGSIITLPFVLSWSRSESMRLGGLRFVEVMVWFGTLILFGTVTFRNWAPTDTLLYPMELAIFPIMAWASVRFGMRGASGGVLALALLAAVVLASMMEDDGGLITQSPGSIWIFVGIVSITSICLAAVMSEFRRRETRIAENESRLRAFTDALPDIVFVLSDDGMIQETFAANRAIESNHRIANAACVRGKHLSALFDDRLTEKFLETVRRALSLDKVSTLEYSLESVDVGTHWFEARVSPMVSPYTELRDRVVWVAYDISERKRFEAQLLERDRVLMATARAGTNLLVNETYEGAVGSALRELGQGLGVDRGYVCEIKSDEEGYFHGLSVKHEWLRSDACPSLLEQGGLFDAPFEETLPGWIERFRAGEPVQVDEISKWSNPLTKLKSVETRSVLAVPMWVERRLWGFLAFDYCTRAHDWLESELNAVRVLAAGLAGLRIIREREAQLREARDRADSASLAKGEFLAIMSHEIRTPMNAIVGYTDLLRQTDLDEVQREQAAVIKRSGTALLELINNILDYSKIESQSLELESRKFDLEQIVCEALESVLPSAKDKGLEVDFEIGAGVDEFYIGDPHRIRQILLNLSSNAVKFTENGSIVLRVDRIGEAEAEAPEHRLHFEIADTGCGIEAAKLEYMFEPFSQADTSTTRRHGGTGLGLAISRKLVDRMGGAIWAESTPGEGSVFQFDLSLKRLHPEKDSRPPFDRDASKDDELDAGFAKQHPLDLLLCEDDEDNRWVIRELLETLGYEPDFAEEEEGFLERLEAKSYDAVLLDIRLPGRSGLELAKAIRGGGMGENLKDQYVIAVTAYAMEDDREECLRAGMNDYLSKPLEIRRLKDALNRAHAAMRKEAEGG